MAGATFFPYPLTRRGDARFWSFLDHDVVQTAVSVPPREVVLFRRLAASLFVAKNDVDVAQALLAAACVVSARGGAVYLAAATGFRRAAASGTGLTFPLETDQLQRAALTVHRKGHCALVHDRMEPALEDLLDHATALPSAALDQVGAKAALPARSPSMADRVAATDERAVALAGTVEKALLDGLRQLFRCTIAEVVSAEPRARETMHSQISIPLHLDGAVVGILNMESEASGLFGDEHRAILESLGPQLAIAVALARRIAAT